MRSASKRDLIRRASLDLTGLPSDVGRGSGALRKDTSKDAFAKVVDRASWHRLSTESDGAGSGWMSLAMAKTTIEASIRCAAALTPIRMRMCTGTG